MRSWIWRDLKLLVPNLARDPLFWLDAGGELELQPLSPAVRRWHLEFDRKVSPGIVPDTSSVCASVLATLSAQKIVHHSPRDVTSSSVFTLPLKVYSPAESSINCFTFAKETRAPENCTSSAGFPPPSAEDTIWISAPGTVSRFQLNGRPSIGMLKSRLNG